VTSKLTTAFAFAVLGVVAILIVPLPPPLLDALPALNVFGSAPLMLVRLRVEAPLEFPAIAALAAARDYVPDRPSRERPPALAHSQSP